MKKTDIKPNEITKGAKASMKTRIITAIVGITVVVPFIFLGDWFYAALVAFLSVISTLEIIRCLKVKRSVNYLVGLTILSIIICFLMVFWPFLIDMPNIVTNQFAWYHFYSYFTQLHISVLLVFIGFALLFLMVVFHTSFTVRDATFMFTMLVVISLGLQSLLFLRCYPSYLHWNGSASPSFFNTYDSFEASILVIYVLIATFLTDSGAYFVGLFFGKRKINERISPKKTYAGFIGGLIVSFVGSAAFGLIFALCHHPMLEGYLDINHWYYILILSALIPLFSTLGDFVFSSIKRFYDIKDFGNILPGHGGILDRIDSLLFSLMASAMFIWVITNIDKTDLLFRL